MIPDLDIFRSANFLVKQHGEDAPIHAAMRADAMLEAGDLGGYGVSNCLTKGSRTHDMTSELGMLTSIPVLAASLPCSHVGSNRRHRVASRPFLASRAWLSRLTVV